MIFEQDPRYAVEKANLFGAERGWILGHFAQYNTVGPAEEWVERAAK